MTIGIEKTEQQKLREAKYKCLGCAGVIEVGPNYPVGVVIPRVLELFCRSCKVINILYLPGTFAEGGELQP